MNECYVEIGSMREETQVSSERWRWIPNTGEYLLLENIKAKVYNKAGLALPLNDGYTVKLKGAYDRSWDTTKSGDTYGNIYNNRAAGIRVATLNIDGSAVATVSLSTITVANNERLYSGSASGVGAFSISKGGWLELNGSRARLGIRPESAATAYPGDDYVLTFTVEYTAGGTGSAVSLEARSDVKDYVAVYDKKMLWRANLYIDQTEFALGNLDWNNAHPWNTSAGTGAGATVSWWNVNDWEGSGNGGQIALNEWTRWNDNEPVQKTVAYGWGCWDSVKSFNDELVAQSGAIKDKRNENETYNNLDTSWQEGQTKAPAGVWKNYLFKERSAKVGTDVITTYTAHVSVPGLSTYWDSSFGEENSKYNKDIHSFDTCGIDCSGLAHRAALYDGNNYEVNNQPGSKLGTGSFASNAYTRRLRDIDWKLESDKTDDQKQKLLDQKILSQAVPGDLLVISGNHVVIIQNLHYEIGETVLKHFSDVDVIHSTRGGDGQLNRWNVQKGTWGDLGLDYKALYQLRRYK